VYEHNELDAIYNVVDFEESVRRTIALDEKIT